LAELVEHYEPRTRATRRRWDARRGASAVTRFVGFSDGVFGDGVFGDGVFGDGVFSDGVFGDAAFSDGARPQ
jgi:hypothetical protein